MGAGRHPCGALVIYNDLVPRTVRYHEKARAVVRRRERGKGRQPTSKKARPRGSIEPMVARKAKESGESGSISKAERSSLGEKTSLDQVCHIYSITIAGEHS